LRLIWFKLHGADAPRRKMTSEANETKHMKGTISVKTPQKWLLDYVRKHKY
jgi:hypothetical protein